jgi:hypothetical protein
MSRNTHSEAERLLYDSGRIKLGVRLLFMLFGLLCVWCALYLVVRRNIIAAVLSSGFGVLFISIWFYRWRVLYDSSQQQIVFRSWGTWRVSLLDADAVYVRKGRGGPFAGGPYVDISLRYKGGKNRIIVSQPIGDPNDLAAIISKATALPIIQEWWAR